MFCTQLVAGTGRQQETVCPSKLYTSAERKRVQEKNKRTRLLQLTLNIYVQRMKFRLDYGGLLYKHSKSKESQNQKNCL